MGKAEQPETGGKDDEFPDRTRDKQLWRTGKQIDRSIRTRRDTAHAKIKRIESRSAELALVMKHVRTYRQLKPLYDRYRKSNDKEKVLRGHEGEIILFEAATRELKRLGAGPLPTNESMKTELTNLNAEKERLLTEYKTARTEAQEYDTVKQNVDALLAVPKEQEQQCRHELEYFSLKDAGRSSRHPV